MSVEINPATGQPSSCKDLHCFNSTFAIWFVQLQEHTSVILEPDDWKAAYNNGTTPCTALTDKGLTLEA